ncbi:hypothetical protein BX666DRAFT_1876702 [Dichotomocladium elegans]|nr:hypothetical protein BX666DRAFT_1876702 [Dichotomocladium elegans]
MTSPMTTVKPDPDLQEEQDELMSYLNADCLSADSWPIPTDDQPPSPPYSTSSDGSVHTTSHEDRSFSGKVEDLFGPNINMMDFTPWLAQPGVVPSATNNAAYWAAAAAAPDLFQPFVPPCYFPQHPQPILQPTRDNASCSSSSDSEQPKKKRGRKKRDTLNIAPAPPLRPLARLLPASTANVSTPSPAPSTAPPHQQQHTQHPPAPPVPTTAPAGITSSPAPPSNDVRQPIAEHTVVKAEPTEETHKAAAIAKRQERLIKNRAAALLSRKRKREHLIALEEEKQALSNENEQLKARVAALEVKVDLLEKENQELRRGRTVASIPKHSSNKATGVVFMIMLFSFALFSLPGRTVNQLTVGGTGPRQLVGSTSSTGLSFYNNNNCRNCPTLDSTSSSDASRSDNSRPSSPGPSTGVITDLVLIDPVQPHALRNWIQDRLTVGDEKGLVQYSRPAATSAAGIIPSNTVVVPQIYLYSPEFSQVAPVPLNDSNIPACESAQTDNAFDRAAVLSFISPLPEKNSSYLQIDVQVLGSRVIDGQLMPLDQCPFATSLLDGLKGDLLCAPLGSRSPKPAITEKFPTVRKLSNKDMRRRLVGQDRARKYGRVVE